MSEDEDARELFGPAQTMPEPHWNPDPAAFARAGRRQGRLRAVSTAAGATLSVAAVAGVLTFAVGDGKQSAAASAEHLVRPVNYDTASWEKVVDIDMNLPTLFNQLLPDGPKFRWIPADQAQTLRVAFLSYHGALLLTGADGTDSVSFSPYDPQNSECPDTRSQPMPSPPGTKVEESCTPTKVSGGTVYAWSYVQRLKDSPMGDFSYTYLPDDKKQRSLTMRLSDGSADHPQLTPQQFADLVDKPDFAKLTALVDPAVKPSPGASARRVAVDSQIAGTVGSSLPAGFTLRLTTTDLSSSMELVGPRGISGAAWLDPQDMPTGSSFTYAENCLTQKSEYSRCETRRVPGGKLVIAHADRLLTADAGEHVTNYAFVPDNGDPKVSLDLEDATATPGMTPDEFLAVATKPGIHQLLTQVNTLAQQ